MKNILILFLILLLKNTICYLTNNYRYKSLNLENSSNKSSWFNNEYKTNTGIDMRFPNNSVTDTQSLLILQENLEKLVLLKKLKNNNTSTQKKLELIEESDLIEKTSYVTTLHAGGLMNDFNHQL